MGAVETDPDDALVAALTSAVGGRGREEAAAEAGLPVAVVAALEREGLLGPTEGGYSDDDVALLRAGRMLLDAGIPLGEVLALGRKTHAALASIADDAVEVFVRFVRDPVLAAATSEEDAAARLVGAYQSLLPATERLIGTHFRALLLARARERSETA